ncbi:MAG: hypothetical protein IEMM0002_1219 [bacterium]|nr:MAG: hypothetical protein IEMM0002_1219 [bacterium]
MKFQYGDVGLSTREESDISEGGENFGGPYWEGMSKGPKSCGGSDGMTPMFKTWFSPSTKSLYVFSAICSIFLFWGGPNYYSARSFRIAWNLGHIFFFFILTLAIIRSSERAFNKPFFKLLFYVLSLSLLFALAIELLQGVFDRIMDMHDVWRDILGSLAALFFFTPGRKTFSRNILRAFQVVTALFILMEFVPLAKALTDEAIARRQFPILSGFETPFEMDRWKGDGLAIEREIVRNGKASMKVHLTTEQYSGVQLEYFPPDWRKYRSLKFSIYNSSSEPLRVVARVHDEDHVKNGQPYYDRFNMSFVLSRGWNDLEIPIERIANAPKKRAMNLRFIKGLGIFVMNLPEPWVIYLDDVMLSE